MFADAEAVLEDELWTCRNDYCVCNGRYIFGFRGEYLRGSEKPPHPFARQAVKCLFCICSTLELFFFWGGGHASCIF